MKKDNQTILWLLTYFVNAVILYFASLLFPNLVVFGTASITYWEALLVTALLITAALMLTAPIAKTLKFSISDPKLMGLTYGVVNITAVWILARNANWTGFGVSSSWIALVLGVVLNLVQFGIWKSSISGKKHK